MDTDSMKVFQPPHWGTWAAWIIFISIQAWLVNNSYENGGFYYKPVLIGFLFFEGLALYALMRVLAVTTEKVTITRDSVFRTNLYSQQEISISDIKFVKKEYYPQIGGGISLSYYAIRVGMNSSEVSVGRSLSEDKIDQAVSYILEQMRVYHPESFVLLKDEESYEVENFWRK